MSEHTNLVVLRNSRKFLQSQFAWPKFESEKWFVLKYCIIMCLTAPILLGSLAHFIVEIYEKNGAKIDLDITILISIAGIYYYNIGFVKNIADIIEGCKMLSDFEKFGKPNDFETTNTNLNRYSKIHFVVIHLGLFMFMLTPISYYQQCQKLNHEKNLKEVCGLLPLWLPIDIDYFPVKQIFFLVQTLAIKYSYVTTSMVTIFIWECFEHLVTRMRHVGETFVVALNQDCYEKRRIHLNRAIEYHNFLLRCANLMIESFKESIIIHIVQTGMLLGCIGYQLIQSPNMVSLAILGGYINSFILISVVGEKLANECLVIGNSIYKTQWHNLEVDIQKDLILVIMRCQKPAYIKAGPYATMTHRTILSILKTAYSVMSLLKAIS